MKGTLALTDSLASLMASQVSINVYGKADAYAQIQDENTAYNEVVAAEMTMLAERSSDVIRAYGGAGVIDNEDMGEFDSVDSSKVAGVYAVGFPLTRHGAKIGYTDDWLATNSADQLAAQYLAARTGDQQKVQSKIRRALYYPFSRPAFLTNGTRNANAYSDRLVQPPVAVPLYPLLNADGNPVPIGPNGETFDPTTHTHYVASDWTASGSTVTTRDGDLQATVNNLTEHKIDGELMLIINRAQEASIRALPNFVRNFDATVQVASTITYATGALDVRNYNNRMIGTYNGFEVWVKPWALAGKIIALATGGGAAISGEATKVIVWRTRPGGLWADYNFRAADPMTGDSRQRNFPITAEPMTRDGDCSVWGRHLAVILDVTSSTYTVPTLF